MDCNKIDDKTKDLMFSLIEKSYMERREQLVRLCEDREENIYHSNICTGNFCEVILQKETECPPNTKEVGNFHTHPILFDPSTQDIISAAARGAPSICIGGSTLKANIIRCYDIVDKELLDLGLEANKFGQKGDIETANKIISDMVDITRLRHRNILNIKCDMTRKSLRNILL